MRINVQQNWKKDIAGEPTEEDLKVSYFLPVLENFIFNFVLQRYQYYVLQGVSPRDLPPMPATVQEKVKSRLLQKLLQNPKWKGLRKELWDEVEEDYRLSWQKSIVDYILMDSSEKKRLGIKSVLLDHPQRVIRAPVPWHNSFHQAKGAQTQQLFINNHIMTELQLLWWSK